MFNGSINKNMLIKRAGNYIKVSLLVVLAATVLLTGCSDSKKDDGEEDTKMEESDTKEEKKNKHVVGEGIDIDDITDFYWTYSTSTDPPDFQRYYFYVEDGKHMFHHETREGDVWPLTEEYITVSGTFELDDDRWEEFYDLIKGGRVREKDDDPSADGDSTYMYMYWKGDKEKYREYVFESYAKEKRFEEFCIELVDSE
ncbi:MAG: hypothetical protein K5888_02095 [Lachnospiraceae bacterium]|nr:hypothetical protein [Lachnospiraceae bacterium]